MSAQQVRAVTLNLWGQNGAWAERRAVLIDGLRTLRPDLVAFQETIKTDEYDQVIDLLGSEFHIAHQVGRDADGFGISIASRWPLTEVQEVDLHVTPRTADFACTTLVVKIRAPDPIGIGRLEESTTFLCVTVSMADRRSPLLPARASSTNQSMVCGQATISALSQTSRYPMLQINPIPCWAARCTVERKVSACKGRTSSSVRNVVPGRWWKR
ncbi:endonuclease/exonuclease/phosphatase family protein [Reticulibacter mediterranei]|uniref:endonuclease/exonuclease/phosphatase family protein n=1 Tax=Reticulibacter mediterranei TaxID=2778369 RepID=UPI00357167A0